jgi:hypothetical protein
LYGRPLPAAQFEVFLRGRRLGLPAEDALENVPDRSGGLAAGAHKAPIKRKLRRA